MNDRCEASGVAEKIDTLKQMHGKTTRKSPGGETCEYQEEQTELSKIYRRNQYIGDIFN